MMTTGRFAGLSRGFIADGGLPMADRRLPKIAGQLACGCLTAVFGLLLAGCTPAQYRQDADKTAYDIIRQKQEQANGRAGDFNIEQPADTLRRRLMINQDLPHAAGASLSSADITPIKQWPDPAYLREKHATTAPATQAWAAPATQAATDPSTRPATQPVRIAMIDALQIGARNARDYQTQKEQIYLAALRLDLERNEFRGIWTGALDSTLTRDLNDPSVTGVENGGALSLDKKFKNGLQFTTALGLDLVKLLTGDKSSSFGITSDTSVLMPLLRGSSQFIVTEPLTQAERDVIYAIWSFERFKKEFAVRVASDYLGVLQQLDAFRNAEDNYKRLVSSTRRAQRLAEAGRLPEIQVDQSRQNELRARERWISSKQLYLRRVDTFKISLGLPADAELALDRSDLQALVNRAKPFVERVKVMDSGKPTPAADAPVILQEPDPAATGPLELPMDRAINLALNNRLDLRIAIGQVDDAQRSVAVAADNLRADLSLLGRASAGEGRGIGSASQADANLNFGEGRYSVAARLNLPLERTAQRNTYAGSLVAFERAVRQVQAVEDEVKLDIRNALRRLLEARETLAIQSKAVELAQRRVDSTSLFLEAGRAQIRDLLEAQDSLIQAQNAFTAAVVTYRITELEMQRDMEVLRVDETGLWTEFKP